jgi:hypothetical protein
VKWLAVLVIAGAVAYAWREALCKHVDEDGRSMLIWERQPGEVYGRCTDCGRRTAGWAVPWRHRFKTPVKIRRGVFALLPFKKVA